MEFLDVTFPTIEENLAFEEAMLLVAEDEYPEETLRLWDARQPFIVLGRGSKRANEVDLAAAAEARVPCFRRISGGATVVAANGCMFYAVVLSLQKRPHLRMLDQAHQFVLGELVQALRPLQPDIEVAGTSDLVVGGRKVSGNSLRVTRDWLLYHGTLLLDMDLSLVATYLHHPPREPEYRGYRGHAEFLTNLHIDRQAVADGLQNAWNAHVVPGLSRSLTECYPPRSATPPRQLPTPSLPADAELPASTNVWMRAASICHRMQQLIVDKYSQASWNQ